MGSRVTLLFVIAAVWVLAFSVQAGSSAGMWLSRTTCSANEPAKLELRCGQKHLWHEAGVLRWIKHHSTRTLSAEDPQVAAYYTQMRRNHLWLRTRAWRWVREARGRLSPVRSANVPQGSVQHVICAVFGAANCSEALHIARVESGYSIYAANGQYLGIFQMGSGERGTYATIGYSTAYQQVVAAHNMFLARGWEPWTCCEG